MWCRQTTCLLVLVALWIWDSRPSHAGWLGKDRRESNAEVVLVSFGSTFGEIIRYQDHSGDKGGLARRVRVIDSLRTLHEDVALIDLGDFVNNESTVGELKSRFIWKQMENAGCLVSAPGGRELRAWSLYQELLKGSPIRCVSSNLAVVEDGKERPVGHRTLVLEVGGVRVGFFALLNMNLMRERTPEGSTGVRFKQADPIETARRIIPELQETAEVVVLLSQLSGEDTESLVQEVAGIDVALFGYNPRWNERCEMVDGTITQQTSIRGKFLGQLILIVDPAGRIIDWGSRDTVLDERFGDDQTVLAEGREVEAAAKSQIERTIERERLRPGAR